MVLGHLSWEQRSLRQRFLLSTNDGRPAEWHAVERWRPAWAISRLGQKCAYGSGNAEQSAFKYERDTLAPNKPRSSALWFQIALPLPWGPKSSPPPAGRTYYSGAIPRASAQLQRAVVWIVVSVLASCPQIRFNAYGKLSAVWQLPGRSL